MGFLGVETKYAEPFSQEECSTDVYCKLTENSGVFKDGAAKRLVSEVTNQLWRNALLALSVRQKSGFAFGHAAVLACDSDAGAEKALKGMRAELPEPNSLVRRVTLEQLITTGRERPALKEWAEAFERRYLVLSPTAVA